MENLTAVYVNEEELENLCNFGYIKELADETGILLVVDTGNSYYTMAI